MDFKQFSNLIMIEQTLFALPFALLGTLFAGGGTITDWILVIIAVSSARTAGMSFNRVIDAKIDARNPRTKDRLVARGEISPSVVWLTALVSSVILVFSAFLLNDLCFYLSFPAVFLLFTYSFFKRFSASSHVYLGVVEAAAPIGGYLAVTGELSFLPFILGAVILFWIAGLDMVYALQDEAFDRKENLKSIPAVYGRKKTVLFSSVSYGMAILFLLLAGALAHRGQAFYIGVLLISAIFVYQQLLARKEDITAAIPPFFKVNMLISPILFFSMFIDVYLG